MKVRGPVFLSIVLIGLLVAAFYVPANNAEKEAVMIKSMLSSLDRFHFQPQKVDDAFSKKVFKLYLDRIDGNKRWLTQSDVDMLDDFETQLDDEADAGTYEFFDLSLKLLENGLEKTQGFYREILATPFDFSTNDKIEMDGDKKSRATSDAELKDSWKTYLKYETLTRLAESLKKQKDGDEELKGKSMTDLEKEAREDVLDVFDKWYKRLRQLKRNDRLSTYLNAVANVYDPHTGYFKPRDKQDFDIRMSKTLEGIGARLQTDGDYTKVVDIVVGGPAWKGKELKADDLITKVAQKGEEPVDVTGMVIGDVVDMIRGKKGTDVILTVKSKDGAVRDIQITRDVVIMEEGYAKSAVIKKEKGEKVGYIGLPSFYADFGRNGGHSSADDVAKELAKLKAENVSSIVLDLRNNGGGSLDEVVKMAGLFIEEGPIVQVKSRIGQSGVHEDEDPKVQYDGPLVIMVNEYSASASEILAAALQDYGRAVVVGSESTFGKGTVQRFLDLDRAVMGYSEVKPLGQIKLTIQKYYRVNGGSVQLRGVVPNIILPDNYQYLKTGEKEYDYALDWTEIKPVKYDQQVTQLDNLDEVRAASARRVAASKVFQNIDKQAKWLKEQRDITSYSMNLDAFTAQRAAQEKTADEFDKVMEQKVKGLSIQNLASDLAEIKGDESKEARNTDWIEGLEKDVYVEEVLAILKDMK